jgi:hypothetical protein
LLNCELSAHDRVIRDESKSLGLASVSINIDFSTDDITKRVECSGKVCICEVDRKVVDEKVGTGWAFTRPRRNWRRRSSAPPFPVPSSWAVSRGALIRTIHSIALVIRMRHVVSGALVVRWHR